MGDTLVADDCQLNNLDSPFTKRKNPNSDHANSETEVATGDKGVSHLQLPLVETLTVGSSASSSAAAPNKYFNAALNANVIETYGTGHAETLNTVTRLINEDATEGDAFYVLDLGDVYRKYLKWQKALPRVEPFYAIKCNTDPMILRCLSTIKEIGFDCASKAEIDTMLKLGANPDMIIFANPCKPPAYLTYARKVGVRKMTFDNEAELIKIKRYFPEAQLVLRVLADDSKSICRLGLKFGVPLHQTFGLLKAAKDLELDIIGVSFHVGSGCTDPSTFADAVARARKVFDEGASLGFNFTFLDIGGGFPGNRAEIDDPVTAPKVTFEDILSHLAPALDKHFPPESGVRIISEPGRYFVSSSAVLACNVIAKRAVQPETAADDACPAVAIAASEGSKYMYYINDGVYGSFNCTLFDHVECSARPFPNHPNKDVLFESSVWGPTCDSMDCIERKSMLPELQVGEWVYFNNMGAYTMAASSTFNGFPRSAIYYTFSAPADFDPAELPANFPVKPPKPAF